MTHLRLRAALLAFLCTAAFAPAVAATTAHPTAKPRLAQPPFPTKRERTEFVVMVNAKGQVVGVKSKKGCDNYFFNAQTLGNVLQMWIRHPDGSAEVGLYRVVYEYDPHTRKVARAISLVRAGGDWGNREGAAAAMMDTATREAQLQLQKQAQEAKNLPPLRNIIDATPTPKP